MSQNPLQKYFRQPKIFTQLPSRGHYIEPDVIDADPMNLPVYAMTGMDEIMLKTPDALFNGESTVKVLQSCCPNIKDGWKISAIDLDHLLIAIRIATYGSIMEIEHVCGNCSTNNEYDVDLQTLVGHLNQAEYKNSVDVSDEITVKIRPLTYQEMTKLNLENFKLQKSLINVAQDFEKPENQQQANKIYQEIADLQNDVFIQSIASVNTDDTVVTDPAHIREWIQNSESSIFEKIKSLIEENRKVWKIPNISVECGNCSTPASLELTLDQANFFVRKS